MYYFTHNAMAYVYINILCYYIASYYTIQTIIIVYTSVFKTMYTFDFKSVYHTVPSILSYTVLYLYIKITCIVMLYDV